MKTILIGLVVWLVLEALFLFWWARLPRAGAPPDMALGRPGSDLSPDIRVTSDEPDDPVPSAERPGHVGGLLDRALHLESRANPHPPWLVGPRRRGFPSKLWRLGWVTRRRGGPAREYGG